MERIKTCALKFSAFLVTLVSALFWVALRVNYSGISKFLGADTNPSFLVMNLPIMVCVLAWIGFVLALLGLVCGKNWPSLAGLAVGMVVTVGAGAVVLFGARDYLPFILPHFWESMAYAAGILLLAVILYFPVKGKYVLKTLFLAAVILAAVAVGYELRPCDFSCGAVVYAVEDDYQIVFSTTDSAVAWVEIGGECYYDLYAGSMKSWDRVHKIEVPQSVLDAAGGYTVCAQQMIYRGPFGGYKGKMISMSYDFCPVNTADGLDYYAISDVHEAFDAAAAAASTRSYDFIVLLGDIVSMVETESDAQAANVLLHRITCGRIPAIYARGNHEIKGEYAEEFYKYVGSKNQQFYYWVTLGQDVFAVVLDLGEDHEDDWWEYYGTAHFDLYRQAQSDFLTDILDDGSYADYRYRMALCHIPIVYVDDGGLFAHFREEWTGLLNKLDVDICLSGHQHKLYQFLPGAVEPGTELVFTENYSGVAGKVEGSYLTDFRFPAFLVGRRSLQQTGGTQKNGFNQYTGMAVRAEFDTGRQICCYINSQGQILTGFYPFVGDYEYLSFSDIGTDLKRPEK